MHEPITYCTTHLEKPYLEENSPFVKLPPKTYKYSPAKVSVCLANGGGIKLELVARNIHDPPMPVILYIQSSFERTALGNLPPKITKPPMNKVLIINLCHIHLR